MLLPLTQVQSLAPNGVYGRRPGDNAAVDSLPDLLLIERSRGGEQRAIEALVRRYSRRLFRLARRARDDRAHPHVPRAAAARGRAGAAPAPGTGPLRARPRAARSHRQARAGAAASRLDADDECLASLKGHAVSGALAEQDLCERCGPAEQSLGGVRFVLAHQAELLARAALELERHERAQAHPLRGGGRLDEAGAGTPCAEVAQVALDARAGRLVAAVARGLSFGLELAHARLDGLQAPWGDEVRMRADGSLGERRGIGIRLAYERAAHAASPVSRALSNHSRSASASLSASALGATRRQRR